MIIFIKNVRQRYNFILEPKKISINTRISSELNISTRIELSATLKVSAFSNFKIITLVFHFVAYFYPFYGFIFEKWKHFELSFDFISVIMNSVPWKSLKMGSRAFLVGFLDMSDSKSGSVWPIFLIPQLPPSLSPCISYGKNIGIAPLLRF